MKSNFSFYDIYWRRRQALWNLELFKNDKLSPDLVYIKELQIELLDKALKDKLQEL